MGLFGTSSDSWWWLCTDSCGLTCATITWMLHFYGWSTVTSLVINPWFGNSPSGWFHWLLFTSLTVLALVSHARAMLTNPGAVPCNAFPLPHYWEELEGIGGWRKKRFCMRCKAFKPPRAHHDSVTGRCILRLDHYCPWVNNAVGLLNHKFFLLFVLYTFITCLYSNTLVLTHFFACAVADTPESAASCEQLGALTFLLFLEAVLFGLFTMCMICDQSPMLLSYETKIDRLKGVKHSSAPAVNEVFGIHSSLVGRLSPFHSVVFPRDLLDEVLGFVVVDEEADQHSSVTKHDEHEYEYEYEGPPVEDVDIEAALLEEDETLELHPSQSLEIDFFSDSRESNPLRRHSVGMLAAV